MPVISPDTCAAAVVSLGVDPAVAHRAAPLLARFVDELHRGNDRFGLIGREDAADPTRLLERHVLDSLGPWRVVGDLMAVSGGRRLYDLGSGPGLPGIPLALVIPDLVETVLVERRGKRVSFLLGVVPVLRRTAREAGWPEGTPAIRVVEADATQLRGREAGRTDEAVVVFRAYQQTSLSLAADLSRTFGPGTPVCALKGRHDQAHREVDLLAASPHATEVRVEELPAGAGGEERSVLVWTTGSA